MARNLASMPTGAYHPSTGADVMNYLCQGNDALATGINGQVFTKDNFVELSNIIFNDQNLRTQLAFELYDKIGLTYVASNAYRNQLKMLKKDVLNNGAIVEEIAMDKIEPMPYNPEVNWQLTLKNYLPTYAEIFHKLNRAQVYPLSNIIPILKRATTSEATFLQVLNEQLELLSSSNEIDEFEAFLQLIFYIATDRAYPIEVNTLNDDASYKDFVALVNTYANNLTFASRDYNMLNFKRATPLERMIFITTSEVSAHMNVYVNAPAYNLEFVKILTERTIIVPSLPENCVGLLMDDRLAQIYDVLYATDSNHNGLTMSDNQFLHVQQIISSSLQFNAIAFYTSVTNPTQITTVTPVDNTTLTKGQTYPIQATVNQGYTNVKYKLEGNTDENTQITPFGLLYIGQNEQTSAINVIVTTALGNQTKTMTYYIKGNTPVIQALYPVSGSTLDKNQSYQLSWKLSSGNGTPTFTLVGTPDGAKITSDGLLTIESTYATSSLQVKAEIGSSSVTNTYTIPSDVE